MPTSPSSSSLSATTDVEVGDALLASPLADDEGTTNRRVRVGRDVRLDRHRQRHHRIRYASMRRWGVPDRFATEINTPTMMPLDDNVPFDTFDDEDHPLFSTFKKCLATIPSIFHLSYSIASFVVLVLYHKEKCDSPLSVWLVVQGGIQMMLAILLLLPRHRGGAFHTTCFTNSFGPAIFAFQQTFLKVFYLSLLVWLITGVFWAFNPHTDCSHHAPHLFSMVCASVISELCIVALGIVIIFISCCVLAMCYFAIGMFCVDEEESLPGASQREIECTTTAIEFQSDSSKIASEDAQCVICLCKYDEGESLRILSCSHHFHKDCIDTWLKSTKTCPQCRRPIDEEVSPSTQSTTDVSPHIEMDGDMIPDLDVHSVPSDENVDDHICEQDDASGDT